jgi:integrase
MRVTAHALRHTHAVRYLKLADRDVAALTKVLGHPSLAIANATSRLRADGSRSISGTKGVFALLA